MYVLTLTPSAEGRSKGFRGSIWALLPVNQVSLSSPVGHPLLSSPLAASWGQGNQTLGIAFRLKGDVNSPPKLRELKERPALSLPAMHLRCLPLPASTIWES